MKKILVRLVTVICALSICITVMMPGLTASAVTYSGSGTMQDPYLVTNAEQLQGMRENLSAHYKLANTIDLSGVDFKPIGRLDGPFTGSFVCELNADKTPKYIIKNLTVSVAETKYAAEKKNKWEAALFGAATGATFSGIYVLDAKISNEVLGDNTGAVVYSDYKPGMDEMNSAILIGEADSCTVMNCGTTGKIDTKASSCGGLIGRAGNTTVENCYTTADVVTKGKWGVGGLIGQITSCNISFCYATGYVESVQGNASAFIETVDDTSSITNCYATGNTKSYAVDHHGASAGSAFISVKADEKPKATLSNCFSIGSASAKETISFTPIANCYSLKGTKANTGFTEVDKAALKAAFSGLTDWDVSGDYPVLTTMGIISDASKYQPGVVDVPATTSPSGTTSQTASGITATTQQSGISADEVAALIEKLPSPEDDTITIDDKDAIKEAWLAYEQLSVGDKEDFDSNLYSKLNQCRAQVSLPLASEIVTAIKNLPDNTEDYTAEDIENILKIYEDYNFLDDAVKAEFKDELVKKLEAAYEYASRQDVNALNTADTSKLTTTEIIIVIISAVIILMAVAFYTFAAVIYLRKAKRFSADEFESEDEEATEE